MKTLIRHLKCCLFHRKCHLKIATRQYIHGGDIYVEDKFYCHICGRQWYKTNNWGDA